MIRRTIQSTVRTVIVALLVLAAAALIALAVQAPTGVFIVDVLAATIFTAVVSAATA